MAYFPLFLSLEGQTIFMTGGGQAAWTKVQALAPFHPRILVLSRTCLPELLEIPGVEWLSGWSAQDLDHLAHPDIQQLLSPEKQAQLEGWIQSSILVIQATGSRSLSRNLQRICAKTHTLFNAVDQPGLCQVVFPAIVQEGALCIGISTSGASPRAAQWLKRTIAQAIPDRFPALLDFLSAVRPWVLEHIPTAALRKQIFSSLFELGLQAGGVPTPKQLTAWIQELPDPAEAAKTSTDEPSPAQHRADFISDLNQGLLEQCLKAAQAANASCRPDQEVQAAGGEAMPLGSGWTAHPAHKERSESHPALWPEETGCVWIAGAGCGSKDWLTLQVQGLLESCDVLVYDDLIGADLLELAKDCRRVYVGKRLGRHSWKQEDINQLLCDLAREGLKVLRLKGGDPFVFGRGMEEVQALRAHQIPYRVAPGLSSALAIPLRMEIPVTHRGLSTGWMAVTYGRKKDPASQAGWQQDVQSMAGFAGTIVILMGASHIEDIARDLIQAGKDPATPAALISSPDIVSSQMAQAPLCQLAETARQAALPNPGLLVIGPVVQLARTPQNPIHAGAEPSPVIGFAGTDRLYQRLKHQCPSSWTLKMLVEGTPRLCPSAKCAAGNTASSRPAWLEGLLAMLEAADGQQEMLRPVLAFTSPQGAQYVLDLFREAQVDIRQLWKARLACVGQATAQVLKERGLMPDLMPEIYTTQNLADVIGAATTPQTPIVLFRSERADEQMEQRLQGRRWQRISLYTTSYAPAGCPAFESTEQAPSSWPDASSRGDTKALEAWAQSACSCQVIVLGSRAGAQAWLDICRSAGVDPHAFWYVVLSEVTASWLREQGIDHIHIAAQADASSAAACLRSLLASDTAADSADK